MRRLDIDISKEQLEKYFFEDAMSVAQVAREFGCDGNTIRRRLQGYGIELDPGFWYRGASQYARKLYLQGVKFTSRQESIVVGTVLGDSHLNKRRRNRYASLYLSQCIKHREYVDWMWEGLQPFFTAPVYIVSQIMNGAYHYYARLHTIRYPEFDRFHTMFYPEGKKSVPKNIGEYLNELALAVWYMDDGCTGKSYSILHTQGFTESGCNLLLKVLYEKFNIEGCVRWCSSGPTLMFLTGTGGHRKFHDIIDPLLHPCFEYKRYQPGPVRAVGESHHWAKLNGPEDVKEIRRLAAEGVSQGEIAGGFGITQAAVSDIVNCKNWKHVA